MTFDELEIWFRNKNFVESNFEGVKKDKRHQTFWEMWFGFYLEQINLNPDRPKCGLDYNIKYNGMKIFFECTAPTAGDTCETRVDSICKFKENDGFESGSLSELNKDKMKLRITGRIEEKIGQVNKKSKNEEFPCILAINLYESLGTGGVVAKHQIEKVKLDWSDVSQKLIDNGLATRKSEAEINLSANSKEAFDRMEIMFGMDFPAILLVLQQSFLNGWGIDALGVDEEIVSGVLYETGSQLINGRGNCFLKEKASLSKVKPNGKGDLIKNNYFLEDSCFSAVIFSMVSENGINEKMKYFIHPSANATIKEFMNTYFKY